MTETLILGQLPKHITPSFFMILRWDQINWKFYDVYFNFYVEQIFKILKEIHVIMQNIIGHFGPKALKCEKVQLQVPITSSSKIQMMQTLIPYLLPLKDIQL